MEHGRYGHNVEGQGREIYSLPWILGGWENLGIGGGEGGTSHINGVSTCQPQTGEGRVYSWLSEMEGNGMV